jgi:hypothetical protein
MSLCWFVIFAENGAFLVFFGGKHSEGEKIQQFGLGGSIQRVDKYDCSGFGWGKCSCAHLERHQMHLIGDF